MPRRDREMIGQTIKITRGSYKGKLDVRGWWRPFLLVFLSFCSCAGNVGIVKDSTDTTARVELHTSCQTISVEKGNIMVVGAPAKVSSSEVGFVPEKLCTFRSRVFLVLAGWFVFVVRQNTFVQCGSNAHVQRWTYADARIPNAALRW
jgi:hypothetical protein